jgi:hypothetical protein
MTLSHRHHYIPRFLIDKFADESNSVWVYNKIDGTILKNKKSSKSIFFERDRNNFELNDQVVDNIEKLYGDIDSSIAKVLDSVLSTHTMSGRDLTMLILLATFSKWRVPSADEKFHSDSKSIPLEDLGVKIRPVDPLVLPNEKELDAIKEMEIFREVKRLIFSTQSLLNEESLNEIHKNSFIVSYDEFPALLGDVPIIEKKVDHHYKWDYFIFPLSSSETLICSGGTEKRISHKAFYLQKDLTILHIAKKYVVCKSREHLVRILGIYKTLSDENKTHLLEKFIFEYIK